MKKKKIRIKDGIRKLLVPTVGKGSHKKEDKTIEKILDAPLPKVKVQELPDFMTYNFLDLSGVMCQTCYDNHGWTTRCECKGKNN